MWWARKPAEAEDKRNRRTDGRRLFIYVDSVLGIVGIRQTGQGGEVFSLIESTVQFSTEVQRLFI